MAYNKTKWEDLPSEKTPLNAANLNKLENGIKQIHDMAASGEFNGKDGVDGKNGVNGKDGKNGKDGINGIDGKDGTAVFDENSVEYGLSVKDGKLNLGRYDDERKIVIVDTPAKGYDAFMIGRIDETGGMMGFVKTKGYMRMVEGDAYVTIMADNTDGLVGASPMMDGKNRVGINGYRITVTGDNEIILAVSDTGSFSAGIRIDKDNNAHAHNKVWDQDTLIVNNKKLMDEIKKLEDRIALLESK